MEKALESDVQNQCIVVALKMQVRSDLLVRLLLLRIYDFLNASLASAGCDLDV